MRKLLLIGLALMIAIGVMRGLIGRSLPRAMESMMEKVMPRVMDARFAQMSDERRRFMLGHCRGLLDQMDEKYMRPRAA